MASTFQSFDRSPLGAFIRSPLGARGAGVQAIGGLALLWDGADVVNFDSDFALAVGPAIFNFAPNGINSDQSFDVGNLSQYGLIVTRNVTSDPHWWAAFVTAIANGWRGRLVMAFATTGFDPTPTQSWVSSQGGLTGMSVGGVINRIAPFSSPTARKQTHPLTASVVGDWPDAINVMQVINGGSAVYAASEYTDAPGSAVVGETSNGSVSMVVCAIDFIRALGTPTLSNQTQYWHNLKNVAP